LLVEGALSWALEERGKDSEKNGPGGTSLLTRGKRVLFTSRQGGSVFIERGMPGKNSRENRNYGKDVLRGKRKGRKIRISPGTEKTVVHS